MIFNFKNWFTNSFRSEGKKIVKQKGKENIYSEADYREKYINLKEEHLELKEKIHKLEENKNYSEYRLFIDSPILFNRILDKNNIKFKVTPCELPNDLKSDTHSNRVTINNLIYKTKIYKINNEYNKLFTEALNEYYTEIKKKE